MPAASSARVVKINLARSARAETAIAAPAIGPTMFTR
jgi:hypothetical protein